MMRITSEVWRFRLSCQRRWKVIMQAQYYMKCRYAVIMRVIRLLSNITMHLKVATMIYVQVIPL